MLYYKLFPLGLTCLLFTIGWGNALALGTAAGTLIENTVEITYQVGDSPDVTHTERASHTFTVSELIRSNVTNLNPQGVGAATPEQNAALAYTVTNTGNGEEAFSLVAQAGAQSDFEAGIRQLWIESNGEPGWQADDTPYDGAAGLLLTADQEATVYVVADIAANLADQAQGVVSLTAVSMTPGASDLSVGEALPEGGDGGIEAVIVQDKASHQDEGVFVVSGIRLEVVKEVVRVADPYGGDLIMPGAHVTYRVALNATGSGSAANLRISDPSPESMSYKKNSLKLNQNLLTDDKDDDEGYFDAASNTVWFEPGNVTAPRSWEYNLTYIVD